jgi:signal transduction histidine kinase
VNRDRRLPDVAEEDIDATLVRMGKKTHEDELNCGACGYLTCREHAIAVIRGLAETEMCLPYVIEEFQHSMRELSNSHEELSNAREQLMHSERLATMGQLAAGVAHELNNPLGVVLMYTHLMLDEASEKSPMHEDLSLIAQQADRCKRIVAGLLDFARENKALLQHVKIRPLVQRALEGMRIPDDIDVTVRHLHTSEECELDPDQIVQVLTNLLSNAIAAMPEGGELEITVEEQEDTIVFRVRDTGTGIREEHLNKIFQPFFSTKGGKGTGLGLAVTYGIVKMHRGDIKVVSNADPEKGPTGTTFEVRLPRRKPVPSYVGGKDE